MGKVILVIGSIIGLGYMHWRVKHNRYHGEKKKKDILFDAYTGKDNKKDLLL